MNLRCQRNHRKTACEQGRPASSAFYTPVSAKKVIEALREHEPWSTVTQELKQDAANVCDSWFCLDDSHECLVNEGQVSEEEYQRIYKLLQHIHSVTGHGSVETLIKSLRHRGVPERVLEVAKTFKCDLCEERKRVPPRRPATLETIPLKWQRVQCDMGSWTHPTSKDKIKFVIFIDEGSRFRVGKILFENSRNQATWPIMKKVFEENWVSVFGLPEELRADPEGVWRSDEAAEYCQERGVILSPIPAEAHWQIGIVEESIKAVKHVLEGLAIEFPNMDISECFSRAIWACNSRDNQHGYSPVQHAMGRKPDEWGRLFEGQVSGHPVHPQQMVGGGFAENIKAMATAEQAFSQYQARARLARAEAAGRRPLKSFMPGDLVFYWRKQVNSQTGSGFSWRGHFMGPARVLAVETRQDEQGRLRPGSCVWLHRAGRLIKAAPEQLRPATSRENAIEELKGPCEIPWTITSLATHPNRRTYWDISLEVPTDLQWQEASEHPTRGRRFSSKRSLSEDVHRRARPRNLATDLGEGDSAELATASMATPAKLASLSEKASVETSCTAVEIDIELPTSKRGLQKFMNNPEAYVVSQLKKSTTEVKERFLTDQELLEFRAAKDKEVRSYIQSHCFKVLPPELQDRSKAVSLVAWRSGKIQRKCRSPACAEVHAVVNAEDDLFHIRYLWSELHYSRDVLQQLSADEIVAKSPGIVVTDSKKLYDRLDRDTPTVKGEEKRATIEALALKDSCNDTGTMLRWVHSDAQLGNSFTKPTEKSQINLFLQLGQSWKIVYDEKMQSARKRKSQGLSPMTS
eukprot:s1303_g22.t1